jgi:hypothetical protein
MTNVKIQSSPAFGGASQPEAGKRRPGIKSNPNDKVPKRNPGVLKPHPANADCHLGFGIDLTFELWHLAFRIVRSTPRVLKEKFCAKGAGSDG